VTRILGLVAFGLGSTALFAMLAVDVLDIREVPGQWFGSLALVLTAGMWTVPLLRPQFGKKKNG
jgi:hypothetical protein